MRFSVKLFLFLFCCFGAAMAQPYNHADSLKGTYSADRAWWDVLHYDLHAAFNYPDSSISGFNIITYKVLKAGNRMQIDLREPMLIDSVLQDGKPVSYRRDGNSYFMQLGAGQTVNSIYKLRVAFHGKPVVAKNPPWDGGLIWTKDSKGNPWISIACQGMAASVWFPNKDHMADEADSATMAFTCPRDLIAVSNGRLKTALVSDKTLTYVWEVRNPINNYNIIPYIGKYTVITDTLMGKNGVLELNYWVLVHNFEKAKEHFKQVKSMLHCFEEWFGPYPFYADGYKLVEAPFLGMEHQSAIAYGNDYVQGYRGRDLSLSGWGLKWDFIIVHESGHEWFGNNISAKDVADNWIHESFTAYSENLYVEYLFGRQAGAEYAIGTRLAVLNDKPIIADYNVNRGGSGDLYYKGANMLHTIRQIVNNDSLWKEMLRGLNKTFWHQTVTTKQVEDYMISFLKADLQKVFDQYLRTKQLPLLEYRVTGGKLHYRWTSCVKKFNMPLKISNAGSPVIIYPTQKWQKMPYSDADLAVDKNYYLLKKRVQ